MFRLVVLTLASLAYIHNAHADIDDFPNVPRDEDIGVLVDEYTGYRILNDTRPETYDVHLRTWIHEGNFTFEGRVNIGIVVVNDTTAITLHHRQLNIIQLRLLTTANPPGLISISPYTYNSTFEFLRIPINSVLPANTRYVLEITYSGTLRTDNGGFYRSSYVNNAGERVWLATTQFESTNARHGFPCYDEPSLKANFTIHMTHDPSYSAISNMPQSNQVNNTDGSVTTSFETTPPTSTYLIAFIVSNFAHLSSSDPNRAIPQRVFSRSNAIHLSELILEAGELILDDMADYIDVEYSLPKMDQAAIPDFAAGAMENWGLVTYRENYFHYDVNSSTYTTKTGIITVVAHEYAHQWFGNLVSPRWWTYIWLNEGFADLFEHMGTDLSYPEWQIMDFYVVRTVQSVFQTDSTMTVRPMTYYVESPSAIQGLFSNIAYAKSGSVLRMFMHAFSESTFMKGVKYYLDERAYNDAAEEDLFEGLEEAVLEDNQLTPELDLFTIMYSWTQQGGIPILRVQRNYSSNVVTLSQQRYLTTPVTPPPTTLYWIPYNFATTSNPDFVDSRATGWLGTQSATVSVPSLGANDWLIANKQASGYYRVQYDEQNYRLIADALYQNVSLFYVTNRAQLIDDLYNLARTNRESYATALNMVRFLEFDSSYVSWYPAITMFTAIDNNFSGHENYPIFQDFVRHLIEQLYDEVGILDIPDEPHIFKYARTIAINWACRMGSVHCRSDANRHLRRLINENIEFHQNTRDLTFCAAMRGTSSRGDYDFILNRIVRTNDSSRNALFTALGCTSNNRLLNSYINLVLPQTSVGYDVQFNTTADRQRVFNAVYQGSPEGFLIALRYLSLNLDNIYREFGTQTYTFLNSLSSRIGNIGSRAEFSVLVNIAQSRGYITLNQANTINSNVQNVFNWLSAYGNTISNWLIANHFN